MKITTFGCAEYLRHRGFTTEGELEFREVAQPKLLVAEIQEAVARRFRISLREMKSARRSRYIARPRQVAMYLCREFTPRSLPDIGRRFGDRDHTTVIHAIRQIERLRREDPELDWDVSALERELAA